MITWNVVWPAIYVTEEIQSFWFLVFITIAIEALSLMALAKFRAKKAIIIASVGNVVSGMIGTFVMMWLLLFWHLAVDNFLTGATFDPINWHATFILMCIGSVVLEALSIKLFFSESFRKLFIPLLLGNIMTYSFIAYKMSTDTQLNSDDKVQQIYYAPYPNNLTLLDNSSLVIYTAKIEYSEAKRKDNPYYEYPLELIFQQENPESFILDFTATGAINSEGIEQNRKLLRFTELADTIEVFLKQKNPDPEIGWENPIVSDTILFINRASVEKPKVNSYTVED